MPRAGLRAGALLALALVVGCSPPGASQSRQAKTRPPVEAIQGIECQDGLITVCQDRSKGRILLSFRKPGPDGVLGRYLYLASLRSGVGLGIPSGGLDRGTVGDTRVAVFRQVGPKVLVEYENQKYRGGASASTAESVAARDSLAYSTIWQADVEPTGAESRVTVDVSSFLSRDAFGVPNLLKDAGESTYKLDPKLSFPIVDGARGFPRNVELEARLTFTSEAPGSKLSRIVPDPTSVSIVEHHSLIELPGAGFEQRLFDPRVGGFSTLIVDYSRPLGDDVAYRVANRFRLERSDPTAARSRVKKPIVFYVDRGVPAQVRSALLEGAGWWAAAFEAAGYVDAFKVEELPDNVDPLDSRYNVVLWVDRATRGWSYGQPVIDPRSGEIVKALVILEALRMRRDLAIYEGLVGTQDEGTGKANDPIQVARARLRQLAAHEIGHALGFAHNFAGSTQNRASVMDYPPPRVSIVDGKPDLTDAYGIGLGAWDRFAADWLYAPVPPGAEGRSVLDAKAREARTRGMRYVTDPDARPVGAAQPWGSVWDDGADPVAELRRIMDVRRIALAAFGPQSLAQDEPLSDLQRKIVPIYLFHRFQMQSTAKLIGGVDYPNTVAGDAQSRAVAVDASVQRAALSALMETLSPSELDVPETVLAPLSAVTPESALSPMSQTIQPTETEVLPTMGGGVFDPLAAADIAASLTMEALLSPPRLSRLVDQHRRDPKQPGVEEIVATLVRTCFREHRGAGRLADLERRVEIRAALSLAKAARDPYVALAATAIIEARLRALAVELASKRTVDAAEHAHREWLASVIRDRKEMERVLARPAFQLPVPPGQPIEGCSAADDGDPDFSRGPWGQR